MVYTNVSLSLQLSTYLAVRQRIVDHEMSFIWTDWRRSDDLPGLLLNRQAISLEWAHTFCAYHCTGSLMERDENSMWKARSPGTGNQRVN